MGKIKFYLNDIKHIVLRKTNLTSKHAKKRLGWCQALKKDQESKWKRSMFVL